MDFDFGYNQNGNSGEAGSENVNDGNGNVTNINTGNIEHDPNGVPADNLDGSDDTDGKGDNKPADTNTDDDKDKKGKEDKAKSLIEELDKKIADTKAKVEKLDKK